MKYLAANSLLRLQTATGLDKPLRDSLLLHPVDAQSHHTNTLIIDADSDDIILLNMQTMTSINKLLTLEELVVEQAL